MRQVTPAVQGALLALDVRRLDTIHGRFRAHRFHNLTTGQPALAVATGRLRGRAPLLARVHSSCVTSEVYGACDCDCAEQLDAALAAIGRAGRGVLFYLSQEGRGAGFAAKARDRMLVQASRHRLTTFDAYERLGLGHDQRRYDEVAAACHLLGIAAPLRVLTNNPEKLDALRAAGVAVAGHRPVAVGASPFSVHYLAAKSRSGHLLVPGGGAVAVLPERVTRLRPRAVRGAPRFLELASYLLPLRTPSPAWFRLHLYLDVVARRERVVLTHGLRHRLRRPPLVHVQHDALLERFPLRRPHLARRWARARAAIVRHGAGCVLFLPEGEAPEPATVGLLARHLPGRRAGWAGAAGDPMVPALARAGIQIDPVAA
jgi:3,4-dihydroxy 2-butanone 4-phosphate synthase / GTP cyclohydrolase II